MTVETPARPDETTRELEALMAEARRRARRRRFGYAAGAVAVLLAISGLVLFGGDDADQRPGGQSAPSGAATAQADLVFARGIVDSREALYEVDLTTGAVERLRLRMSCGDTPFCLISTGGELVISSVGRTTAYSPAASGPVRADRLGNGWITIPSSEDGRVWLGILARGKLGGQYRRGLSELQEIDLEGNVVRSVRVPNGRWPVGAVESGLLFQYGQGLRLWSHEERAFTLRLPGAYPAAMAADLVAASRGGESSELVLSDTRDGDTARVAPPAGYRWTGRQGLFTPIASRLAVPTAPVGGGRRPSSALAVVDTRTLDAQMIPSSRGVNPVYAPMAWSSDGDRLFFVARDGTVMSYAVGSSSATAHARFDSDVSVLQVVAVRP